MATPRCARSLFGPAKRAKISTPTTYTHTFSRARTSRAEEVDDKEERKRRKKEDARPIDDSMGLEERLERMGIDPVQYQKLYKSQQAVEKRQKKWEPKTQAEATEKLKAMQQTPDHHTMLSMYKQAGVEPIKIAKERGIQLPGGETPTHSPDVQKELDALRAPVNVQAMHLRPLRRAAEHGVPVCDLQLRTYSIRNLLLFADFAVRAAYYMGLAARGPVPLPRITERWTVPRANFVMKKSQENFERITMRRLIQIQDGHPDVVKAWLAFLAKHQYYGVGMKANIWEYESLEAATSVGQDIKEGDYSGRREKAMLEKVNQILAGKGYKEAMQGYELPKELQTLVRPQAPVVKEKRAEKKTGEVNA